VAYGENQLFNTWTSADASLLNGKDEWHTWFIMPAHNVVLDGSIKDTKPFTLISEQIRGRDRLKPVYYYFPEGHKGFVFLLHGTGGRARSVVQSYEFVQLIKDLVNDNFGIVVTESEESTTGVDANGDGKIRWNPFPADSLKNVDYANIRIITDTLYKRDLTDRSRSRYSIGMSNGGSFSAALSALFNFKCGVSYCASGRKIVAQISTTPFLYCMARFDNNENVGAKGNAEALSNSQTLTSRGVCSKYLIKERSPLYPERFARRGDISTAKSNAIFNELKTKGYLDNRSYCCVLAEALVAAYRSDPSVFPEINSLTQSQKLFVVNQIALAVSDHQMYSDYNRATLRFLNAQCN
jgi:hypothetical protein